MYSFHSLYLCVSAGSFASSLHQKTCYEGKLCMERCVVKKKKRQFPFPPLTSQLPFIVQQFFCYIKKKTLITCTVKNAILHLGSRKRGCMLPWCLDGRSRKWSSKWRREKARCSRNRTLHDLGVCGAEVKGKGDDWLKTGLSKGSRPWENSPSARSAKPRWFNGKQ